MDGTLDAARLFEANQQAWRAYWPEAEHRWMLGRLDGASLSLEGWRRTLEACGRLDDSLARVAAETHAAYTRQAYRLHDGAAELLEALGGRLPLGLITNGAADTQRERLRWFDLEGAFAVIAISGELGVAKPDAAIFRFALDRLAIPAEDIWHAGDSLRSDVAGARAMGMTAIWVNRTGTARIEGDPEPDIEVASLTELFALVASTE